MSDASIMLGELKDKGIRIDELKKSIGGNSKLYKFILNGKYYVLKVYIGETVKKTQSRKREIESLYFLRNFDLFQIPKLLLEFSPDDGLCLQYIPGKNPRQNNRTNLEILRSFRKLKKIYMDSPGFINAVDACFSTSDVIKQIENRLQHTDFFNDRSLKESLDNLKKLTQYEFPKSSLTYSFSDVGAHNMIRRFSKYWFIDFEFFGQDSAVKMISDYILHPRNVFTDNSIKRCFKFASDTFGIDAKVFFDSIPFFAAKWATIVSKRFMSGTSSDLRVNAGRLINQYLELSSIADPELIVRKVVNSR